MKRLNGNEFELREDAIKMLEMVQCNTMQSAIDDNKALTIVPDEKEVG